MFKAWCKSLIKRENRQSLMSVAKSGNPVKTNDSQLYIKNFLTAVAVFTGLLRLPLAGLGK